MSDPTPSPLRLVSRPSGPPPSDAREAADAAVVEAILDGLPPAGRVLVSGDDGWLAEALTTLGASAVVDGGGPASSDHGPLDADPVDVVAFPLAPPPDGAAEALAGARGRLDAGGRVVVLAVHPARLRPYADGPTTLDGLPAYGRTLASWVQTLAAAGLVLRGVREPLDGDTGRPAALVLIAEPEA